MFIFWSEIMLPLMSFDIQQATWHEVRIMACTKKKHIVIDDFIPALYLIAMLQGNRTLNCCL